MAVLSFWFWSVSEICRFLCLSLMRSFVVQIFSFFRTSCGKLSHLGVFIVVPFISSFGLAIVAEANLRCGDFLSEKSCHSTGSFYFFLVLTNRLSLFS